MDEVGAAPSLGDMDVAVHLSHPGNQAGFLSGPSLYSVAGIRLPPVVQTPGRYSAAGVISF
jgi:hypothetical protein